MTTVGPIVDKFEVLLFLHILGAFLICGGAGVGMAAGIAMPRTTSVRTIGLLSVAAHRATMFVTLPGALIVIATGSWFVADYEVFALKDFWLWTSYVLWLVAVGLDHGLLGPLLKRVHARAQALEAAGVHDSDELRTEAAAPIGAIVGNLLLVITIVALYLMVFTPGS